MSQLFAIKDIILPITRPVIRHMQIIADSIVYGFIGIYPDSSSFFSIT